MCVEYAYGRACARGSQKRVFPLLKLELQAVVSLLAWVVGTKLSSPASSECTHLFSILDVLSQERPTLLPLSLIYFTVRLWECICVCPHVQCTCTYMYSRGQHGCFPQLLSILFVEAGPLIKPEALILLHCLADKPRGVLSPPPQGWESERMWHSGWNPGPGAYRAGASLFEPFLAEPSPCPHVSRMSPVTYTKPSSLQKSKFCAAP